MKKVFLVLAIASGLAACNNSGDAKDNSKDSLDSIAAAHKKNIDSTTKASKQILDSTSKELKKNVDSNIKVKKQALDSSK
jgi:ABC-type uncharacterized transport system auxiliary subunit